MSSWVRALHVTHFGGAGKVLSSIAGAGGTPGRFPPEVGARILSALDAAHASEQPAAGDWNPSWETIAGFLGSRLHAACRRDRAGGSQTA